VDKEQIARQQADLEAILKGCESPSHIRTQLRQAMWQGAGIFRNAADLSKTLEIINHLPVTGMRADSQRNLSECCIVRNMCLTASLICRSALIRKESRGAHVRVDIPQSYDASHSPFSHTFISPAREGIEKNRGMQ